MQRDKGVQLAGVVASSVVHGDKVADRLDLRSAGQFVKGAGGATKDYGDSYGHDLATLWDS